MPTISCVIPAYNEAARIARVLEIVLSHPQIAEVIVVDDGSRDATAEIAERCGARTLRQPQNGGKTRALVAGICAAQGDLLLLLDADLEGLASDDISALISPVLRGTSDAALSLRGNAPAPWRALGLDYISGERILPRLWITERLGELDTLAGFGFEVWLNSVWIARRARIAVIRWPGVRSPLKSEKSGLWAGIRADLAMMQDIFRTVSPLTPLRQIIGLRNLRC